MGERYSRGKTNWIFEKLDPILNLMKLPPEERSRRVFTGLVVIVTAPYLFVFSAVHLMADNHLMGLILSFMGLIILGSVVIGRHIKDASILYRINAISLGLLFLYLIGNSEFFPNRMLWSFIFPLTTFYLIGRREGLIYNLIFLAIVILILQFSGRFHIPVYPDTIFKSEFSVALFIVMLISYSFEDVKSEYQEGVHYRQSALEAEKEKLSGINQRLKDEIIEREQIEKALIASERQQIEANKELKEMFERVKVAEEELSLINTELEKRVEDRTEELRAVNEKLKLEIRERLRATQQLTESEEKYRALFEESLEAMSLTRNGTIIDVNPAWMELHGYYRKDEVLGMDVIRMLHPEDRRDLTERRRTWPERQDRVKQMRDLRKDGTSIDVEVYSSYIEIGGETTILATIRDITERKRAEKTKRDLEDKLRRAEKMEAIGILAGGVAHDLNNILSGLVGYPELLLMELHEDSPLRNSVETIQRSGQKAAAIVQDLLTLARRGVKNTEVLNLNTVISDFLLSPEFEKIKKFHLNVDVKFQLADNLLNIEGSPVHLTKTIMNLVSNASEAMPEGGELRIRTGNKYIDRPISGYDRVKEGDYAVVAVSDLGIGINKDDLDRIFEPFFTKKSMGRSGTGLGMTVVWGTVKDHGGYIDVKTEEGRGTTFTLYFPATRKEIEKDGKKVSVDACRGKGETILVIDDVKEQREIACSMLKKLNYNVVSVESGEKAVEYVKDNRVDLLVLDMIMEPGIDGFETYKRILKHRPDQKAVIASGFAETDNVRGAQRLGAGKYIRKPYTLEELGGVVKGELKKEL